MHRLLAIPLLFILWRLFSDSEKETASAEPEPALPPAADQAPLQPIHSPAAAVPVQALPVDPTAQLSYSQAVLADNPVAYWRLNETTGTTAIDASGNEHHGSIEGGVTLGQEGPFQGSRAAAFDGQSGHIEITGHTWGGGSQLTVEAWVNVTQPSPHFQAAVAPRTNRFVHLHLRSQGNVIIYASPNTVLLPVLPQAPLHVWQHLVLTVAPGNVRLYKNGREIGADNSPFSSIKTALAICIGSGYRGRFFHGRIAEVAIYNHALSREEIQAHLSAAGVRLSDDT